MAVLELVRAGDEETAARKVVAKRKAQQAAQAPQTPVKEGKERFKERGCQKLLALGSQSDSIKMHQEE